MTKKPIRKQKNRTNKHQTVIAPPPAEYKLVDGGIFMTKQNEKTNFGAVVKPIVFGVLAAAAATLVLMCAAAFLISALGKGIGATVYIAPLSLAVGGFLGGTVAAKKAQKNGLLSGAVTGVVLFFIITVLSLSLTDTDIGYIFWIKLGICVFSSALGGIFGVNSSEKPY